MEFKSGMLGCCIIMLMLGASIFGTILISADANTYDVTKYRFETEVTGLFPVDNSPEFMDYDLSRNYTGYYITESVINGEKYWGGATFTSTGVNNYPIKYEPEESESSSKTITLELTNSMTNAVNQVSGTQMNTGVTYYKKNYTNTSPVFSSAFASYSKTLSSFITTMGLSGYDVIEIKSIYQTNYDAPHQKLLFFGLSSDFHTGAPGQGIISAEYVEYEYYRTYPQEDNRYTIACHSCKIDVATNTVTYYYNDTVSGSAYVKTVNLNDAVVTFYYPVTTGDPTNIPFNYSRYNVNRIDYMDISQGVRVTGSL